MKPFQSFEGVCAHLPMSGVDTDLIVPQRFLRRSRSVGFADALFANLRGKPRETFVLDTPAFQDAGILLTGANFGTGSSREHAVWALADFGVRAVIAISFADIFAANCVNNGLLPAQISTEASEALAAAIKTNPRVMIDLQASEIRHESIGALPFSIGAVERSRLLEGVDNIDLALAFAERIDAFENRSKVERPWLEFERKGARA